MHPFECLIPFLLFSKAVFGRSPRYVAYDPPKILPTSDSQTVKAGESYVFRCEGESAGVSWRLPTDVTKSLRSRVSLSHESRPREIGSRKPSFVSTLRIEDLVYTDTGTYVCVYNGTLDARLAPENATSVHLYVSDNVHLLKKNGFDFLRAIQSETLIIKCLPTHPEVEITLWKENSGRVDNQQDQFISFDPKEGFRISPVMMDLHSGTFVCKAKYGGLADSFTASLNVLVKTSFVPRPHISKTLARHVSVGRSFTLVCSVTVDLEVLVQLSWRTPNSVAKNGGRVEAPESVSRNLSMGGTHLKIVEQSLIIHDATLEDQGSYECKVTDHSDNTQTTREFVHILKREESFLRIYYDGFQTIDRGRVDFDESKEPVQWVVHIEAYPKPNVTWFGPDGRDIEEYGPFKKLGYTVQTNLGGQNEITILKIENLSLEKSGNYSVRVQNEKHVKTEHFHLVITDKPRVTVSIEDFYGGFFYFGYEYRVKCSSIGSPIPDISWLFQPCVSYRNCEKDREPRVLTSYTNSVKSPVHTRDSYLKLIARTSGKIICQSCNYIDCENKEISFFVTDVNNGFDIHGPSKVIEREPFELTCSASIYNFTDVEWFKHEIAGEDRILAPNVDGTIIITSQTSDLSFSKVLRFKNASLTDHGRYYCKAFSRDGRIRSALHTDLKVLPLEIPKISTKTNLIGKRTVVAEPHVGIEFLCPISNGRPEPKILWTLNGLNITSPRVQFSQNGQVLRLNYIAEADEGLYVCSAKNRVGVDKANQILVLQSSLDKDFFYANISVPVIIAVSVALILVAVLIIAAKLCFLRKRKCGSWKAPPTPPTPRLTQFDLPVDDGECNEVCQLTASSRDHTPPEDCHCTLPPHRYATHHSVMPYYSNCSVCEYSAQTLPMNRMMMTLPRHHYDVRSPSPSKLSAEF